MIGHDFGPTHASAITLSKHVLKSEGIKGFYKGAAINVLRGTGGKLLIQFLICIIIFKYPTSLNPHAVGN